MLANARREWYKLYSYVLTVPGRPVPAVRMTQKGKFVKPEAARYLEYKEKVGWIARFGGIKKINGNIAVRCRFYVKGGHMPDIDNLLKSILDSLNGIAWEDDRQIAMVFAERIIGTPERAEIEISNIEEFCKNMPLAKAEGG